MGGEIQLQSEPGKGATFSFTARLEIARGDEGAETPSTPVQARLFDLETPPPADAERANGTPRWTLPGNQPHPALRLLVVEDNPVNQELAAEQLRVLGYPSEIVGDAQSALDVLDHQSYDLVLMDCEMPVMDGYEATREIRRGEAGRRHTAIIAMTAHVTSEQHLSLIHMSELTRQ